MTQLQKAVEGSDFPGLNLGVIKYAFYKLGQILMPTNKIKTIKTHSPIKTLLFQIFHKSLKKMK